MITNCTSALERQIGEAERILLSKSVLNSSTGYNMLGVARLRLYKEDAHKPGWKDHQNAARKAEKSRKEEEVKSRKRRGD